MVAMNIAATVAAVDSTMTPGIRGTGHISGTIVGTADVTTARLAYRQNMAATIGEGGPSGSALDELIEAGLTVRQALRLIAAATAGRLSGAGTDTETIRNAVADSKSRIVATVDAAGNRTAIVYDVT